MAEYDEQLWVPETGVGDGTEFTADRMNHMEAGIKDALHLKDGEVPADGDGIAFDLASGLWVVTELADPALLATAQQVDEKDQPGGYAGLDGSGLISTSALPALGLTTVQTAASQAAMLALTTQAGDVVVRTDEKKTYMHNGGTAGTMADFTLLDTPTDAVTSVNGQTGTVVLGYADVGAQAAHANLTALAGLTFTADRFLYINSSGNLTQGSISAFSRTVLDDADATAWADTLNMPRLNLNNIFTGTMRLRSAFGAGRFFMQSSLGVDYFSITPTGASVTVVKVMLHNTGTGGIGLSSAGPVFLDPVGGVFVESDQPIVGVAALTGEPFIIFRDTGLNEMGRFRGLLVDGVAASGVDFSGEQFNFSSTRVTHEDTDVVVAILHGDNAAVIRPGNPPVVVWVGSVEPDNLGADDIWIDTSAEMDYGTGVPTVMSFPAGPTDGQEVDYVADAANGVLWRMKYRAATTRWHFVGGPPIYAEVLTQETTGLATFNSLATVGPSITLPFAGDYEIDHGFIGTTTGGDGTQFYMSYDCGSTGAATADSVMGGRLPSGINMTLARSKKKTLTAAELALVAKYRSSAAVTSYFQDRWIKAVPTQTAAGY